MVKIRRRWNSYRVYKIKLLTGQINIEITVPNSPFDSFAQTAAIMQTPRSTEHNLVVVRTKEFYHKR